MEIRKETPKLNVATRIAASGFNQLLSSELRQDVANHLVGDMVYTLTDDGEPFGFAIFNVWNDVLYLGGIILSDEHQGKGLFQKVIDRARTDEPKVRYLAFRTQSSLMYKAAFNYCRELHPAPPVVPEFLRRPFRGVDCAHIPLDFKERGDIVAARLGSQFPVHRGCYGGPLYGKKPGHPNPSFQQWWDSLCDFERGDAFICIGLFNFTVVSASWPGPTGW